MDILPPSPVYSITPHWIGSATPIYDAVWAGSRLVWLEKRSDRSVLVRRDPNGSSTDLTCEHSIRAGLFYGGGDFCCGQDSVIYIEKSGKIFRQSVDGGRPNLIAAPPGKTAAPALSPDQHLVLFVHSNEDQDSLQIVDLSDPQHEPAILAQGADFYMQPVWHPDGDQFAWVEWDAPNMPWQGSRLKEARFNPQDFSKNNEKLIAGDQRTPVFQPEFSPDGRWLAYITCQDEFDRLVLYDLQTSVKRILIDNEYLMLPAWVQGMRTYGWTPDSSSIYYITNQGGFSNLKQIYLSKKPARQINTQPYTHLEQICVNQVDESLGFTASAPSQPPILATWKDGLLTPVKSTFPASIAGSDLPSAQTVEWDSPEGKVHGIFYPAIASGFARDPIPPVIVHIHSGPTSQVSAGFSADTAFFTSRGFSVLSVNYHGSTGYGRSYRDALNRRWGDIDVLDARSAVDFLVNNHLGDPARLVIKGSSAGGYTVLNALIRYPGVFKAGICAYAVTNLVNIADETFKYEAHYYDSLIGPLPNDLQKYIDWSPVNHADQIHDPLAIFQGADDIVVPPSQAEQIVQALQKSGTPYHYHLFEEEGHGWRKNETLEAYYTEMEQFLDQFVMVNK
jgi:dipeptidyl aminopeptidase/acylaminoacyl peptidase